MKLHFLLANLLFVFSANAQSDSLFEQYPEVINEEYTTSSNYYKPQQTKWLNSAGVSAGQETFIGAKLGVYREFSLVRDRRDDRNFRKFSLYAGPEASLFVFFAGVFSFSATGGVALGPFTLDNAVTYTTFVSPNGHAGQDYGSLNPKIGLQLGPVWLKAGPSYLISGSTIWGDYRFLEINEQPWNFEIRYIGRLMK